MAHNSVDLFYLTTARQFRLPELARWIALEEDDEDCCHVQEDLRIQDVSPLLLPTLRSQRCGGVIKV